MTSEGEPQSDVRYRTEPQTGRDEIVETIRNIFFPSMGSSPKPHRLAYHVERLYRLPVGSGHYHSAKEHILETLKMETLFHLEQGRYLPALSPLTIFSRLKDDLEIREVFYAGKSPGKSEQKQ